MSQLTRRALLRGVAVVALAPALEACGDPSSSNIPAVVPQWVGLIEATGQQAVLIEPQLVTAGLSSAAAGQITTIDNSIQSAANAIDAASTAAQGQSTLTQIELYLNAIIAIPGVPQLIESAVGAAVPGGGFAVALLIAAMPAIEFLFNGFVSQLSAEAKAVGSAAQVPALPTAMHRAAAQAPGAPSAFNFAAAEELLRRAGAR